MRKKCVFVVGPESSGSMLIAKICCHALGIEAFGKWNGVGWKDNEFHKICHRSLPFNIPRQFPDIENWIEEHEKDYNLYFILTTRDITISEMSRYYRWSKSSAQSKEESLIAKNLMTKIIDGDHPYFIWSYETFMYLQLSYLKLIFKFLDIQSDFIPKLKDGNYNKIKKISILRVLKQKLRTMIRR